MRINWHTLVNCIVVEVVLLLTISSNLIGVLVPIALYVALSDTKR